MGKILSEAELFRTVLQYKITIALILLNTNINYSEEKDKFYCWQNFIVYNKFLSVGRVFSFLDTQCFSWLLCGKYWFKQFLERKFYMSWTFQCQLSSSHKLTSWDINPQKKRTYNENCNCTVTLAELTNSVIIEVMVLG